MRVSFADFYQSSIGKKVLMALTGLILVGFLVGHMVGNLKAFGGLDPVTGMHKLDLYAMFLREIGEKMLGHGGFLWLSRAVLLGAVVLHVLCAVQLASRNRRARPVPYGTQKFSSATLASRAMLLGGITIAGFIVFHILHFTTGTLHFRDFREGEVYANVVRGFGSLPIACFYLIALAAVAAHVYHGGWSMLQTLGLDSSRMNETVRRAVRILSLVLFLGFASVPLAVVSGLLTLPEHYSAGGGFSEGRTDDEGAPDVFLGEQEEFQEEDDVMQDDPFNDDETPEELGGTATQEGALPDGGAAK